MKMDVICDVHLNRFPIDKVCCSLCNRAQSETNKVLGLSKAVKDENFPECSQQYLPEIELTNFSIENSANGIQHFCSEMNVEIKAEILEEVKYSEKILQYVRKDSDFPNAPFLIVKIPRSDTVDQLCLNFVRKTWNNIKTLEEQHENVEMDVEMKAEILEEVKYSEKILQYARKDSDFANAPFLIVKIPRSDTIDQLCLNFVRKTWNNIKTFKEQHENVLARRNGLYNIPSYTCSHCTTTCKGKSSILRHLKFCTKNPKAELVWHKCNKCSYKTVQRTYLIKHSIVHISDDRRTRYKCEICPFNAKSQSTIRRHKQAFHSDNIMLYKCHLCEFQTKHKNYLKLHCLIHKNIDEVITYKCNLCTYEAKRKDYLKNHYLTHKSNEEITKWFECNRCKRKFKTKSILSRHRRVHMNPEDLKIHKCGQCSYQTFRTAALKSHMYIHVGGEDVKDLHECHVCSKVFKLKYVLSKHLSTIHADPEKAKYYKCELCSYKTLRLGDLKKHLIIHKDKDEISMYSCEKCSFQTKFKNSLKGHLLTHLDSKDVTWFKCNLCDYQSKWPRDVKKHEIIHKKINEIKLYNCAQCNFQTKRKINLTRHEIVHKNPEEIKWHKCELCPAEFKIKTYLTNHMVSHQMFDEAKLFECGKCHYKSKVKATLVRHLLTHRRK